MKIYNRFQAKTFSSLAHSEFDINEYSKLKFGSDSVAMKFGYELAERFFDNHNEILLSNQCVVIPSPYNYVENAATVMTKHFLNRINALLVNANGNQVEYMTVARKVSYTADYGFLSKIERQKLINQDTFYFNKELVKGKFLIFVDDVRITGSHEEKLIDVLTTRKLKNDAMFLYFASYMGNDPSIESRINFAAIKSVDDYIELSKQFNHHLIVRPIKFLLSAEPDEFQKFIDSPRSDLRGLYFAAIAEGYHKIPVYQLNINMLKMAVKL